MKNITAIKAGRAVNYTLYNQFKVNLQIAEILCTDDSTDVSE